MTGELKKQYKAIGRVIVLFSKLDAQLNSFIGWLISEDVGTGQLVTAHMRSFRQRLDLFFILYKHSATNLKWHRGPIKKEHFSQRDGLVKRAYRIRKRAERINSIRNEIVHAIWFQQQRHLDEFGSIAPLTGLLIGAEGTPRIESGKTGLKYGVVSYSGKELEGFSDRIQLFTTDLVNLRKETEGITKQPNLSYSPTANADRPK